MIATLMLRLLVQTEFPLHTETTDVACYDKRCEFNDVIIECYRPRRVCDNTGSSPTCVTGHGKRVGPDRVCENTAFTECVCGWGEDSKSYCNCNMKEEAKVAIGVATVIALMVVGCGLCITRWYITKKAKVKHHLMLREQRKAEEEALFSGNSAPYSDVENSSANYRLAPPRVPSVARSLSPGISPNRSPRAPTISIAKGKSTIL